MATKGKTLSLVSEDKIVLTKEAARTLIDMATTLQSLQNQVTAVSRQLDSTLAAIVTTAGRKMTYGWELKKDGESCVLVHDRTRPLASSPVAETPTAEPQE